MGVTPQNEIRWRNQITWTVVSISHHDFAIMGCDPLLDHTWASKPYMFFWNKKRKKKNIGYSFWFFQNNTLALSVPMYKSYPPTTTTTTTTTRVASCKNTDSIAVVPGQISAPKSYGKSCKIYRTFEVTLMFSSLLLAWSPPPPPFSSRQTRRCTSVSLSSNSLKCDIIYLKLLCKVFPHLANSIPLEDAVLFAGTTIAADFPLRRPQGFLL